MALYDLERAWALLEEYVAAKPSHGSRDLALEMARIKATCAEDESAPERALRLYGVQLHEDLRASARGATIPDPPPTQPERSAHGPMAVAPGHRQRPGGHDEHHHQYAGAR